LLDMNRHAVGPLCQLCRGLHSRLADTGQRPPMRKLLAALRAAD
jgi:hypothetical protein